MKQLLLLSFILFLGITSQCQLLKRIGNSIKDRVETRAVSEANKTVDKQVDKVLQKENKSKRRDAGQDSAALSVPGKNDSLNRGTMPKKSISKFSASYFQSVTCINATWNYRNLSLLRINREMYYA